MRLTRRRTALFAALASFSLVAGPASLPLSAQPPASASASGATGRLAPATAAAIDSLYLQMSHSGEPGCAAYQNGAITFARGYGFANLTHDVPITPTTRFTTGSVSKQFTAASIALLVRAGRLSLDDDVRKYIPEMNAYPTPVRVRHLVHHTSGLRDFWELVGLAGVRYDDGYTSDDMLAMAARQGAQLSPGSQYRYSDTGYLAMAVIVQRITGQSLRRFADSAIFKPLGMRETLFLDDHNEIVPGRAMAYSPRGTGWRIDVWNNDIVGQGGVVTTLADLQKWDENFYSGTVGGREFLELMHTTEPLTGGAENRYAFGLTVGTYRGQRLVEHTGSTGGYRAALFRFPALHASFAMLCNRAPQHDGAGAAHGRRGAARVVRGRHRAGGDGWRGGGTPGGGRRGASAGTRCHHRTLRQPGAWRRGIRGRRRRIGGVAAAAPARRAGAAALHSRGRSATARGGC